jgi:hypothetical protein
MIPRLCTVHKLLFPTGGGGSGGHGVAQLVEALPYTPEGLGCNNRWSHLEFFIDIILPAAIWPWC